MKIKLLKNARSIRSLNQGDNSCLMVINKLSEKFSEIRWDVFFLERKINNLIYDCRPKPGQGFFQDKRNTWRWEGELARLRGMIKKSVREGTQIATELSRLRALKHSAAEPVTDGIEILNKGVLA